MPLALKSGHGADHFLNSTVEAIFLKVTDMKTILGLALKGLCLSAILIPIVQYDAHSGVAAAVLPSSLCSTDVFASTLTFPTGSSQRTTTTTGQATTKTTTRPITLLDDKRYLVTARTLLRNRIEACENQIEAAPGYSKRYVSIQYGAGIAPNCEPTATVTRPQELIYLYDQLERCVAYENLLAAVPAPPLLFHAMRPTMYILINSLPPGVTQPAAAGGGSTAGPPSGKGSSSGASSAQSASSGQSSTASASGGASQTSGGGAIDNPGTLLLYDIAMRLEPGDEIEPTPPNRVFFIPAPQWTLSSFYNQCLSDPPGATGGTLGAIVIDEATTSNGGQFGLFFVNGWAYVKYSVQLLMCDQPSLLNTKTVFPIELTWHGYGEGKDYRNAISFLPIATWLTYISTKWIPSSTMSSGATSFSINPSEPWNYALQPFLTSAAQITLGDAGTTMTVPRAYDNASVDLLNNLNRYCSSFDTRDLNGALQQLCSAISDACARRQQVPTRARDFAIIEPCGLRYKRPVLFIPH